MMKKITHLLTGLFLIAAIGVNAQAEDCNVKYNLFKGNVTTKKYTEAKTQLDGLLTSCPTLSVNIYKYGTKVAENLKDQALVKKLYEMRLVNFPNKGTAKAHSDYASYLAENNLGSEDEIFSILEKAYKISPKDMGVKNIYKYFQGVTDRYKDTDPQKVFNAYDDVMESVGEKLDDYSKKIAKARKDSANLDSRGLRNLRAYKINSKSLGQVEGGLDNIISEIATCPRLIPLLSRDFDANKNDATWLRRSVSRLYNKGCQSDPLFEKMARAYAEAAPSADSYKFLAGVLSKNGDEAGATQMRAKSFDLETDPFKKAKIKLSFAQQAASAGQKSNARALALEALTFNPNYGKAYLLIANLYAKSANSCGSDEFEKRMVYAAALKMARKAQSVDPGSNAGRYVSSYRSSLPSKKLIFQKGVASGSSYRVGCWIGETVRVP
ncbi:MULTISPECIES: tetratricopeptide repeat protein [Tenacibaculum]|uniref:hypothetical protein n=1 Tax=Tenacibaculum TaxID=104267 RepID=UPI001F0AFC68|nr:MULTISPECIES: hypothetical protein [Tenacibaculum]MCH3882885.1 hypothetical protein [Tenacibaculum aquimarinum]MDO6600406.1 hypothetical protein [Tenacibaculum sp. 1_MG-2023]